MIDVIIYIGNFIKIYVLGSFLKMVEMYIYNICLIFMIIFFLNILII